MNKAPKKVAALLRQSPDGIARGDDVNVPALMRDLGAMIALTAQPPNSKMTPAKRQAQQLMTPHERGRARS